MDPLDVGARVFSTLAVVRQCERHLQEHFGLLLEGLEILELGSGPRLEYLRTLSVLNEVTGISRDIVPQGLVLRDCVELFRHSPVLSAAKTVTRKLLGRDTLFEKTLAQSLGVQCFPRLNVLRMDASRMLFPEDSFDLVCSWSAAEHLDRPQDALEEVARVLRPGGVAYLVLPSGMGDGDAWSQLLPEAMPGARFIPGRNQLRTDCRVALWQKPRADPPAEPR